MSKTDAYRDQLRALKEWDSFLLAESGLPGPRGNLELAQVVADEGNRELFQRYLTYTAERAPVNSPEEFLAFCGVVGLGRLAAEDGSPEWMREIRRHASDSRWRMREGVAMALQRVGDVRMDWLLAEMKEWAHGNLLEQRAAAAALCEPRLLNQPEQIRAVLQILDEITASIPSVTDRRSEEFQALRKGLAYCWSVAAAALPEDGKRCMEKWFSTSDKDIRWIMKENLKKNRLIRVDAAWTADWLAKLG